MFIPTLAIALMGIGGHNPFSSLNFSAFGSFEQLGLDLTVKHVELAASAPSSQSCPQDLRALINWMLQDLPSYTNRVRQRSRLHPGSDPSGMIFSNMLVAGRAEFDPLPLTADGLTDISASGLRLDQIFFTTLDRSYTLGKPAQLILLKSYHWLVLTPSEAGWKFVMMSTRIGHPAPEHPPLPLIDSSDGAIAQAIKLWLRDCQAETLRSKPAQPL
jgi:hypothetical protein